MDAQRPSHHESREAVSIVCLCASANASPKTSFARSIPAVVASMAAGSGGGSPYHHSSRPRIVASATCLRYASTRPPPRCGAA